MTERGNLSLLLFLGASIVAIVVVIIAMGGVSNIPAPSPTPDIKTQQLMQQGTSDETASIEQDLEATEFTELDAELADIEKEVNQ